MLTVLKSPPLVALTGNPIRFTIHSDSAVASSKVSSMITLYLYDIGAEGDWIQLVWGANDITFTCMPMPDDSGTQIPDATCYVPIEDWLVLVVTAMLQNYYVNRDWVLTIYETSIIMTGKDPNVSSPTANFHWNAVTVFEPTAIVQNGIAQTDKTFYKIGLQLWLKIDETWTQIGEDLHPVDSSGNATFDIHRLFADYLYPEFLFPEISTTFMELRSHSSGTYHVLYYEQYGSPITPGNLYTSSDYYALIGGISKSQEAVYNRQGSSFWHKLTYNMYFLSWQPKQKWISFNQIEKLFFLAQSEMTRIAYRAAVYFLDGTSYGNHAISAVDLPPDKGVIELTVSPFLVLGQYSDPTIVDYYEVWLEYQSERISEIRTYHIDYNTYENVRYFLFLNSLGGFDTLRIKGDQEDSLEYDRISIQNLLPADFMDRNHEQATNHVLESNVYKANTGWITYGELVWMSDFFLSKQVFQMRMTPLVPKVGKLVPIVVISSEVHHRTDKVELYSIEFQYRKSYSSEFYSREILTAEFDNDFNDDYPNA